MLRIPILAKDIQVESPFNFPLEIPALQLIGALMSGNKVLVKGDSRVSIVLKKFLELLHHCGLPPLGIYIYYLLFIL